MSKKKEKKRRNKEKEKFIMNYCAHMWEKLKGKIKVTIKFVKQVQ